MSRSEVTPKELDAIEARANAATPGPWEAGRTRRERDGDHVACLSAEADIIPPLGEGGPVAVVSQCEYDNAAFIAHARADVPALVAEVRRLRAERDGAVARYQRISRFLAGETTTQDAVELLSAVLVQDATSAPNCAEWRGDYGGCGFSISVQWADGKSPHTLIDEARRERDEARAILEGRTVPPTDEEIEAHWRAGGHWLTVQQRRPELAGDTPRPHVLTDPEDVRVYARHVGAERLWPVVRWIALDRACRPCKWPVVGGGA